ncbi:hypothetical protein C8J57DRAFT_1378476 [Mycena rebaudengoi]|nr:hypothetical protein C8J57DRAFT_1378476 [Mycena rebaudengoi]
MRAVALRVFRARRRLVRLFLVLRAGTAGAGLHPRAGAGAGVGAVAGWRHVLHALECCAVGGVCLGIHAVTSRAPLSSVLPVSPVRA